MKRLRRCFAVYPAARTSRQDFLMLRVASIDPGKVPRASHDLSIALAGARASLEQDKRFDIHRPIGQECALFGHGVRGDPYAVLQVAEAAVPEIAPQPGSRSAPGFWHVEQDQAPAPVPAAPPTRLRVASTKRFETACLGQAVQAVARRLGSAFKPLLVFQSLELAEESLSVSPAFEGLGHVAPGGS